LGVDRLIFQSEIQILIGATKVMKEMFQSANLDSEMILDAAILN
jgi:hypothetical protein